MPETIRIAVRTLVEYAYRSGDLQAGFRNPGSLAEGTKAHRRLQDGYGEKDRKEVFLSGEIQRGDLLFVLEGRCDGLLVEDGDVVLEEIKSTSREPADIGIDEYPVHWAQAMCYAYLYAAANECPSIKIRLTYVHIDTGEKNEYIREMQIEELERFVQTSIEAYVPFALMEIRHARLRNESIGRLEFPFTAYRPGQRKLAGAVYKTVQEGTGLFAQAPTGIGKTVSVLYPSVKAIGQGIIRHLFYLTAKTTTRAAAEDALALMREQGLHLHTVTLTAKEKICFREEIRCSKESCEFAVGHYDRVNGALLDLLANETSMTRPVIEKYALKHRVCPFEFSLEAAYAADAVICDYNYIFDPRVSLKRLGGEHKKQAVLLMDEAHNLVDRAREMFSAELRKSVFLAVQREFKSVQPGVHRTAKAVNAYFIDLRKRSEDGVHRQKEAPEELLKLTEEFARQAERVLSQTTASSSLLLDAYYEAQAFVRIGSLYDERFTTYAEVSKQDVRIRLFCLDPSELLRQAGKGYRSRIHFSATLTPASYFMDMLGSGAEDYGVAVPSPFSKEQWEVSVIPLSTRYADRERSIEPLTRMLLQLLEGRPGRYLIFFPSYEYMNAVFEAFVPSAEDNMAIQLQQAQMTDDERVRFLSAFTDERERTVAGFAVLGGVFSEGIDLAGDRLNGVVVVGVGLPQIGPERETLKRYFDDTGRNGFDYAYVYPGMIKVLQAGGRLIRSERDKGILWLVDDRYRQPRYRKLLPQEWQTRD